MGSSKLILQIRRSGNLYGSETIFTAKLPGTKWVAEAPAARLYWGLKKVTCRAYLLFLVTKKKYFLTSLSPYFQPMIIAFF